MARLALILVFSLAALPVAFSQQDSTFQKAGVCARCHVISVVEWGMSKHSKVSTDCVACHGASQGHVVDERNNVKPERLPRAEAIAGLCATCHADGCPKTKQKAGCQTCHHVHALVNPSKPPEIKDEGFDKRAAQTERYSRSMAEGERLMDSGSWQKAREAFQSALREQPGDRRAASQLRAAERRAAGGVPGFEIAGTGYDKASGLPREVRVAGLGIPMVLVPGGESDMGSDRFADSKPVQTVAVEPFYLARFELTQAEWKALMGSNPSAHQGQKYPQADKMPVEQVSWEEAQALIRKLNEKVPGGGFRLPTEAEWEYSARAGAVAAPLADLAVFDAPGRESAPRPVGSKKPNKFGLYDLQGNVSEWTSSAAKPYPYDASDGRESLDTPGMRILRGGSFIDSADLLDPAFRHSERVDRKIRWNGLRIARSAPN